MGRGKGMGGREGSIEQLPFTLSGNMRLTGGRGGATPLSGRYAQLCVPGRIDRRTQVVAVPRTVPSGLTPGSADTTP